MTDNIEAIMWYKIKTKLCSLCPDISNSPKVDYIF